MACGLPRVLLREELGVRTIDDLARRAPGLALAGDLQFFERPEWKHVRDEYGLRFRELKPMDPIIIVDECCPGM